VNYPCALLRSRSGGRVGLYATIGGGDVAGFSVTAGFFVVSASWPFCCDGWWFRWVFCAAGQFALAIILSRGRKGAIGRPTRAARGLEERSVIKYVRRGDRARGCISLMRPVHP